MPEAASFLNTYVLPYVGYQARSEIADVAREGGVLQLTMHPHIIGHRSRIWMLDELIRYMKSHQGVWFGTHADVVRHAKTHAG